MRSKAGERVNVVESKFPLLYIGSFIERDYLCVLVAVVVTTTVATATVATVTAKAWKRGRKSMRDVSLWDNPLLVVRTMGCLQLIWRHYYLTAS